MIEPTVTKEINQAEVEKALSKAVKLAVTKQLLDMDKIDLHMYHRMCSRIEKE